MALQNGFTLGVVEGFYGVYYTCPERVDLIRFIGRHGYNRYIYAPKNDRQHRLRWWEPYPARIMAEFNATIQAAQTAGVNFSYGISPGGSICYSSQEDFLRLTAKLRAFYDIGVRAFSLMLDDNEPGFRHPLDAEAFPSLACAQADLANRLYAWLLAMDPACSLDYVPAEYYGHPPFTPSLIELAERLHPAIDLYYTGVDICACTITAEDARAFALTTGRKPLIWDNYPVNDLSMQSELHLGPISGRAADLPTVIKGCLVNPMLQAEASKIPLLTYAIYAADPEHYDPSTAWEMAAREVAGEEYAAPLNILAETVVTSCLGSAGEQLDRAAAAALPALKQGSLLAEPVRALESCLSEMDEAGYALKFRMENLALRNNLLPWIEIMEHWMWMTRFGLKVLRDIAEGQPYQNNLNRMTEYDQIIRTHPKRIATQALYPLIELVYQQVEQHQKQLANPTLPIQTESSV